MSSASSQSLRTGFTDTGNVSHGLAAGWAVGTLGTTTMLNGVSVMLLFYLVTFVKLDPAIAGAMIFGSKLLDVFTDPPMGILSDRTRSRFGRRRPYLLGASLFCGIAFALLFNLPQADASTVYIFVGLVLVMYTLSYTAFQVPYMAMPAELTDDYHQRTRIMSWRVGFMTIGGMTGFAIAPALVQALGNDRAAYGQTGIILGCVIFVSMLASFFGTANGRQTKPSGSELPMRQHVKLLSQNRPLLILMSTKVATYVGLSANISVALFFLSSVLKMGPAMLGLLGAVQAVTSIAFLPVCAALSKKIGKKLAYILSLIGIAAALMSWLLATPEESMLVFGLRAFAIGAFGAGGHLFGQSMLVDTFAWDHKLTGLRREGVLSASFSFIEKASMAFGPLIVGLLLSSMGFDKDLAPTAEQSESAVRAIIIGLVWIPVACQAVSIALLYFYRLSEKDLT